MNLIKYISKKIRYIKYRYVRRLTPILFPNHILNYPFKCRRFGPELTDQFLAERRTQLNGGLIKELNIDLYRELIVDKESENSIKEIIDYYNTVLIHNRFCPQTITVKDMEYMLKHTDTFGRKMRFLSYSFVREFDIWRQLKEEQELKAIKRAKVVANVEPIRIGCFDDQNNIQYGFWKNNLFTAHFEKAVNKRKYNLLKMATLFGQKLVIDCSFDAEMQEYETRSVGRQMAKIYQINRKESREPFDLHFCSCDENSRVFQNFLRNLLPIKDFDKYYINIHSESYSQLFPNERLVYLSPDARDMMTEFDPSATYILGSLIGKTCPKPFTYHKALNEGLECYRLPIHKFVKLNPGVRKVLSFQSCFKILLEVKEHNNWELAFMRGIQVNKIIDSRQRVLTK